MMNARHIYSAVAGIAILSSVSIGLSATERQSLPQQQQYQAQNPTVQTVRRLPGNHGTSAVLGSNSGPSKIECCTTWDSQNGTSGCASFEGNSCPSYAPFEAY